MILPVSSSHIFTIPSAPPDATHLPSGEIEQSLTASVCWSKLKMAFVLLARASQILTFVSLLEVMITFC
jgi:hypothetical protein